MEFTDSRIEAIVDRVVEQLTTGTPLRPLQPLRPHQVEQSRENVNISMPQFEANRGCFPGIDSAAAAAERAFLEFKSVPLAQRKKIIAAIREICLSHLNELAKIAVEETGLGRYDDKLKKNRLAILKTPGVEDLEPEAFTGDDGLSIQEKAPYGVIGSITPCTNPSETIICNGIGMIAGGNAVVFNPHPSAKKISAFTIDLMNKAVISEGGPPNLFTTVYNPTIESAGDLMKHSKIRLLVVTGGPAVVTAAMKSGKRVIAAGPGNPPVVVDDTADLDKAGKDIVTSASCDNNIICVVEKEIIVTKNAAEGLKKSLLNHGAVEIGAYQARRLEKVLLDKTAILIKNGWAKILKNIGRDRHGSRSPYTPGYRGNRPGSPFAREELLMPVLPFIRVKDIDEAMELAYRLEGGCFHTAVIHSKNIDHMHRMAVKMNTSIFVKNGMALAGLGLGGEGPTSFTIASPTGEGLTTARHFTRIRRCVLSGYFRIV